MPADAEKKALDDVEASIREKCTSARRPAKELFGSAIRAAIDEVVDGPRTGRWSIEQLTNPEKTYVGTKIEIIVKTVLDLERSVEQDAVIGGHHVNIKWSKSLVWMIARENIGAFCLGLGTESTGRRFSVGLFRALESRLNKGRNQDKKRTLSAHSFQNDVRWIVRDAELPHNFINDLPDAVRAQIRAEKSAQARLRKLATLVPGVPIPRDAICTIALDKDDPLRRLRQDKYRPNALGGMLFLSGKYHRAKLLRRGFIDVPKDHFVAVPEKEK